MSNRQFKKKLWHANNGKCHWCGKLTQLLHLPEIKGKAPHDLATVDHLRSRYFLDRFVKPKNGERTKVLACYKCNAKRAEDETSKLCKEELIKRGQGFSLNPRGNPIIIEGLNSLDEVKETMREKLPQFEWFENIRKSNGG